MSPRVGFYVKPRGGLFSTKVYHPRAKLFIDLNLSRKKPVKRKINIPFKEPFKEPKKEKQL